MALAQMHSLFWAGSAAPPAGASEVVEHARPSATSRDRLSGLAGRLAGIIASLLWQWR